MTLVAAWDRPFRMWHFSVSYNQLLLRSLSDDASPARVDVLFSNVSVLRLPTTLPRLEIHTDDEFAPPGVGVPAGTRGQWFTVDDGTWYVHATHCQWHEDEGNALTPSHFGPFRRTD